MGRAIKLHGDIHIDFLGEWRLRLEDLWLLRLGLEDLGFFLLRPEDLGLFLLRPENLRFLLLRLESLRLFLLLRFEDLRLFLLWLEDFWFFLLRSEHLWLFLLRNYLRLLWYRFYRRLNFCLNLSLSRLRLSRLIKSYSDLLRWSQNPLSCGWFGRNENFLSTLDMLITFFLTPLLLFSPLLCGHLLSKCLFLGLLASQLLLESDELLRLSLGLSLTDVVIFGLMRGGSSACLFGWLQIPSRLQSLATTCFVLFGHFLDRLFNRLFLQLLRRQLISSQLRDQ